jgi:hypothetical protein
MEKSVRNKDCVMIFLGEDIIQTYSNEPFSRYDRAEEFAKNYFSENRNGKMDDAKLWLLGILYHERMNSIPQIRKLTGYGNGTLSAAIRLNGKLRSVEEAVELAYMKRYGKTLSQVSSERMQMVWDSDKGGDYRKKVSEATSRGIQKVWDNDKDGSFRDKISKTASLGIRNYLENRKALKAGGV